jgi:ligand-binding sensor domain-containing protein
MPRFTFNPFVILTLSLAFLAGCATPLPPTYGTTGVGRVLDGPVLALAGEGDLVVAVNHDGLFMKKDDGPWVSQEVPGLRKWRRITCVAVNKGVIYLGSDGEGLYILSEGTWEVKTSRYGGLPDDGVLSIAIDGSEDGLPGTAIWVGTRKGVAAYREGKWVVYRPDGDWLIAMTGKSGSAAGKVYVGPRFKLGGKGEDSDRFRPPVSAISVGPDRVVFGNRNAGLAVVSENAVATFKLRKGQKFTHLVVDENVIWAGTETGLLWGGLKGRAAGKTWPTNRVDLGWSGTLFGSRDTREFEYKWRSVGYNTAKIVGLEKRGPDLWVAHRPDRGVKQRFSQSKQRTAEEFESDPITDIRRFVEIDEYIAMKQSAQYESYGLGTGLRGEPTALYVSLDSQNVFIGTTKGLWELEQY